MAKPAPAWKLPPVRRNGPKEGDIIRVDPIRDLKDISTIKKMLMQEPKPRNYALFVIGINTSLRASELVRLKMGDVRHLKPMDILHVREPKTGKVRDIVFNKACVRAVAALLKADTYTDDDYVFRSRTGGPLVVSSVHRLVKGWCRALNLPGNYGSHTLRKTWGYHQHETFGVSLAKLTQCFGHESQSVTIRYLCIREKDIQAVYANEL